MKKRSIFIIFVILCTIHFLTWLLPDCVATSILDSSTKAIPILWLLFCAVRAGSPTLMIMGLVFSALGDIAAEIKALGQFAFLSQISFFAVAQLMYLLCFSRRSCWRKGLITGNEDKKVFAIVILVLTGFVAQKVFGGMAAKGTGTVLMTECTVYLLLLMGMALSAASQDRDHYLLFVGGALLFIFSDSVIALDAFSAPVRGRGLWVMITYYAAQYLLNVTDICNAGHLSESQ